MERNNLIAYSLIILIFILAGVYLFYPEEQKFIYSEEINGVIFSSNSFSSPQKYFSETVKERSSFIVVSEVFEDESNLPEAASHLALTLGVFSAVGKSVSSVILVMNEEGETDYCQTNFGDTSKNEKITARQCENLLENSTDFKFIVKLPADEKLQKPVVEMYNNSVVLRPRAKEEGLPMLQQVLTAMYHNSQEIVDKINELLHSVTG